MENTFPNVGNNKREKLETIFVRGMKVVTGISTLVSVRQDRKAGEASQSQFMNAYVRNQLQSAKWFCLLERFVMLNKAHIKTELKAQG